MKESTFTPDGVLDPQGDPVIVSMFDLDFPRDFYPESSSSNLTFNNKKDRFSVPSTVHADLAFLGQICTEVDDSEYALLRLQAQKRD